MTSRLGGPTVRAGAVLKTRGGESGQATLLAVAIACGAVVLGLILVSVGSWYVARGELQQAADVAAASMAAPGSDEAGRHAEQLARANGAHSFDVRILANGDREVVVTGPAPSTFGLPDGGTLTVHALVPPPPAADAGPGGSLLSPGGAGMYHGPLVRIDAAVICPAVAADYHAMAGAASAAGVHLYAVSGFRTDAQQAVLYRQLGPKIAAPPGLSLHRRATELDLAVGGPNYAWLRAHAGSYGFLQRYSWEPWHWGDTHGC
jgi:hypothetical protein